MKDLNSKIKDIDLKLKEIDFEKNIIPEKNQILFKQELLRKSIHLGSLAIPISYLYLDKEIVLTICFCLMVTLVIPDVARKFSKRLNDVILFFFENMLREKERENKAVLNGASWVMINSFLVLLIFPQYIASISLAILIICDMSAAIFGRRFGKHRIFNKSIEGTVAYNLSGFLVIAAYYFLYTPQTGFLIGGFLAVMISSLVELVAKEYNVDDNFAIPMSAGTVLWLANSFSYSSGMGFAYFLN
jgi:dolichol kinase